MMQTPKVAILYQETNPPEIDGILKPKKPGGYRDSGADIAYNLQSINFDVVLPTENPDDRKDADWVFPDTYLGIKEAIDKGANTLWLNTVLFENHPIEQFASAKNLFIIGQIPSKVHLYDDKWKTNQYLKSKGVNLPNSILVRADNLKSLSNDMLNKNNLNFPVIIKPVRGRGSQGVEKIDSLETLQKSLKEKLNDGNTFNKHSSNKYGSSYIIEEYLQGTEVTVTVMPPGEYNFSGVSKIQDSYWALPIVERYNHLNGIAPYNGTVAVSENSRVLSEAEAGKGFAQTLIKQCEKSAELVGAMAPIRIDCRADHQGNYHLFDLNMKPNMTGTGRPGRSNQDSLTAIASKALGWNYNDLLENLVRQSWPIERIKAKNVPRLEFLNEKGLH